jgi:ATP-dependent Clp protease ATP-binding subunit ClpA
MQNLESFPKWIKEISRFCKVKNSFVLTGNIYDEYLYDRLYNLESYLNAFLTEKEHYKKVVLYEPWGKFKGLGNFKYTEPQNGETSLDDAYKIIEKLFKETKEKKEPISIIVNYSSRMKDLSKKEQDKFFYKIFKLLKNSTPILFEDNVMRYNLLIFVAEKENDLPVWFTLDNYLVKILPIPKPFEVDRKKIAEFVLNFFPDYKDLDENKKSEILKTFVSQTSGLHTKDIKAIVQLGKEEKLGSVEILEAIRRYKIGVSENLWATIDKEKIKNAENILRGRVKGQEKAISLAARSIRSCLLYTSPSPRDGLLSRMPSSA